MPSSLRPGGATGFFETHGERIDLLMWRGRWACQRTLGHYIQELQVHQVLQDLPLEKMDVIEKLEELFSGCLRDAGAQPARP